MASKGDIKKNEIQPHLFNGWQVIGLNKSIKKAGKFIKLKSKNYSEEGKFPVVDQGAKLIAGYVNDDQLLYEGELPVVIFGDHTRKIKFIDFPFAVGADGTKILVPEKFYHPKFFFYYMKSLDLPNFGYSRHFKILKEIDFPIPPPPEQNRIVAKLDKLFEQLEVINASLEKIPVMLKNFRQQVLTQAVTGKLTEEWREGRIKDLKYFKHIDSVHSEKRKPVKVRGEKGFKDNSIFYPIPESWEWIPNYKLVSDGGNAICAGPFGTIFKAKDFKKEGIPIIFLRHVKPDGFNQNKPKYMDSDVWKEFHQEYSIFGGELLITKLGDPPGDAAIYPTNSGVAMVTPDVMKAKYNEELFSTKYASYFFNSSNCKDIISTVSFGMTRLRIDLTMFKSFPVPVPSFEEQQEIVNRVDGLFAKANKILERYELLKFNFEQLPPAILKKAFKGELVSQIESDGNARELLEEIEELKK